MLKATALFRLTARMLDQAVYLSSLPIWNPAELLMETRHWPGESGVRQWCWTDGTDIVYTGRVSIHKINHEHRLMSVRGCRLTAPSMGCMLLSASPDQMTRVLQASERSARTRYTVTGPRSRQNRAGSQAGWSLVNQELKRVCVDGGSDHRPETAEDGGRAQYQWPGQPTSIGSCRDTMLPALSGNSAGASPKDSALQRS
jgi:IclR family pca regulon transcriptional regulator